MGIKVESYPFDWIFSNPQHVVDIMKDDFKLFLDRTLYTPTTARTCGHKIYGANMFNHRNPLGIEEDYKYYTRCVERFRRLQSKDNTLFILSFVNKKESEFDTVKKDVLMLNNYLLTRMKNHYLFVLFHIPKQEILRSMIVKHENIIFLKLYTTSVSNGVRIKNATENNEVHNKLLEHYTFQTVQNRSKNPMDVVLKSH